MKHKYDCVIFTPQPRSPNGVGKDESQAVFTAQCSADLQIYMAGYDWLWVESFPLEPYVWFTAASCPAIQQH